MKVIFNRINRYLNPSSTQKMKVETGKKAEFQLKFDKLIVGYLNYESDKWIFKYSEEFRESKGITPLTNFPNVEQVYISGELWPFFSARIPSMSRTRVKKAAEKQGIEETDLIGLLSRFGKKTITNPFELIAT